MTKTKGKQSAQKLLTVEKKQSQEKRTQKKKTEKQNRRPSVNTESQA